MGEQRIVPEEFASVHNRTNPLDPEVPSADQLCSQIDVSSYPTRPANGPRSWTTRPTLARVARIVEAAEA